MSRLLCVKEDEGTNYPQVKVGEIYHLDGTVSCPQCKEAAFHLAEFPKSSVHPVEVYCTGCDMHFEIPYSRPSYDPDCFIDISDEEIEAVASEVDELVCV